MADNRPNMAQLIRSGAAEATQRRASASNGSAAERRPSKLDRMVQSLSWRDAYARAETYPLDVGGISFGVRQLMMGELTGLGTGATVWPAAVVLIKFLERRFGQDGLAGKRVVELGAGTAAVGLGAAALGATVVLTDMHSIIDLTRQNAADFASAVQVTTHSQVGVGGSDVKGSMSSAAGNVFVELFDWSDQARVEHLQRRAGGTFDYVLVSECVLPKLYPIEPLVAAIDLVASADTVVFVAYEHRDYEHFYPPTRFRELMESRGFRMREVPVAEQHPTYSLPDDVYLWELVRADASIEARAGASANANTPVVTGFANLHWFCEPGSWPVVDGKTEGRGGSWAFGHGGSSLTLHPDSKKDFWRRTYYKPLLVKDDGPCLMHTVDAGATVMMETRFTLHAVRQFDQAGLVVRYGPEHWVKTGIEYVDGAPKLSCVVTNKYSDWSTQTWPGGTPARLALRVHKIGRSDIVVQAAAWPGHEHEDCDGGEGGGGGDNGSTEIAEDAWNFVRIAHLDDGPGRLPADASQTVEMGVFACCPEEQAGGHAVFHRFQILPGSSFKHNADGNQE